MSKQALIPKKNQTRSFLLTNDGFTATHILNIVKMRPPLLLANSEKTLLPNLAFFRSIGLSSKDLARQPRILTHSLDNGIIPCYDIIRSVPVNDKMVAMFFRHTSWMHLSNVETSFVPNVLVLRTLGVPESLISKLVTSQPDVVCLKMESLKNCQQADEQRIPPFEFYIPESTACSFCDECINMGTADGTL